MITFTYFLKKIVVLYDNRLAAGLGIFFFADGGLTFVSSTVYMRSQYNNIFKTIYLNCGAQACVTIYRLGHNVGLGLDWPLRRSTSFFYDFILFTDAENA